MLTFLNITLWLSFLILTSAANIDEISFSNLEIAPLTANTQPDQGWTASFDFTIADASTVLKGDEFSLSMPHIYRIKLSDTSQTTTISLKDGTEAFKCYVSQQAAYLYENTVFTCTAQTDLSSYNTIDGSITFSLNFSNGISKYKYELENAKFFKSGPMLVQLGDQLSDVVNFDSTSFTENVLHSGRTTGYGSFESYHLGMRCPNGHFLGGTEKIDYDNSNHNVNLDCSSVQVYSSNDFNDWWFPQSYNDTHAEVTCFGSNLWVTLDEELGDGEMLWVNALQSLPVGTNTIDHALEFQYTCFDTMANTTYTREFSTTREFIVYQGQNFATASVKDPYTSTSTIGLTSTHTSAYSTESTESTFSVGTRSHTTSEVIIHLETPSTKSTPTNTSDWKTTHTSTYSTESTESIFSVGTRSHTTSEVIIHLETPSTKSTPTNTSDWKTTHTSTYSTESTESIFSVGSGSQTTSEAIIHVETPNKKLTSTAEWTSSVKTLISHLSSPSSSSAIINSTSLISPSTAIETSDASIVKMQTPTIIDISSVYPKESTFVSTEKSFLNASCSSTHLLNPSFSMSVSHTSSMYERKSLSKSISAPTLGPILNTSTETKTTTYFEYTILTSPTTGHGSSSETVALFQSTKTDTSLGSTLKPYYSSTSSSEAFNSRQSFASTSITISIYEGKASTFSSTELGSIFFLVLSYLLY